MSVDDIAVVDKMTLDEIGVNEKTFNVMGVDDTTTNKIGDDEEAVDEWLSMK